MRHAALAAKLETHVGAVHLRVAVAQRRQAERTVLAGVLFVADANQRLLEQLHDRGEHLLARQPWTPADRPRSACGCAEALPRTRAAGRISLRRALRATAGDSGTACVRAHRVRSPADGRAGSGQIHTSVHAGGIASDLIRWSTFRVGDRASVRIDVTHTASCRCGGCRAARDRRRDAAARSTRT